MKRLSLILLTFIFTFGFTLVGANTQASVISTEAKPDMTPLHAPIIDLPEPGFNFGKVKEGKTVRHDFSIKNTGTADLAIYKADTACVCTTVQPVPLRVKPGGRGVLNVILNTTRKLDGEYKEAIILYSNDAKHPTAQLFIKADITDSTVSAVENKPGEDTIVKTITPQDARALLKTQPATLLVDVREPEEYKEGHIPGSLLLPLNRIEAEAPQKLAQKDAVIIVYCRSGARSNRAAQQLTKMGYPNVNDMAGGILNWPYEVEK